MLKMTLELAKGYLLGIMLGILLVILIGCKSAEVEAGEVTAPGIHVKDVKVKVEGKESPKLPEKPE